MSDRELIMAKKIAGRVNYAGGRAFFVGGYVRDSVMGRVNKDIDIEVHGVEPETLLEILAPLGEVLIMGASFKVMNIRRYALDISLPEKIHGGEFLAALRRDFTMNALMQDILTGEILDFFRGLDDIEARVIRHVSSKSFARDPLRVFRAARFSASLDFEIADDTAKLASGVKVDSLPSERVMNELALVLMKPECPAKFFESLKKMKQTKYWFRELKKIPAALNRAANVSDCVSDKLYFMMSALCCELDEVSCEKFLTRLTREDKLIKYVLNMRELINAIKLAKSESDYMKVFDASLCPKDLLLLADIICEGDSNTREKFLALYDSRMREPYLMGRDLLSAGVKPGELLGRALGYAHKLRLEGITKSEQLTRTLEFIREGERHD